MHAPRQTIVARFGLAALLAITSPATAEHRDPGDHGAHPHPGRPGVGSEQSKESRPGGWIEQHADRLELDTKSIAAIRAVASSSKREFEKLRLKLEAEHVKLRALLDKDVPVEREVMKQVEAVNAVELALSKNRLRGIIRIRNLLTPEQRRELIVIRQQWHDKYRHDQ